MRKRLSLVSTCLLKSMKTTIVICCYIGIFVCITFYLFNPYIVHPSNISASQQDHVSGLMQKYEDCDLFTGHWIKDMEQPLYTDESCPLMGDLRNCFKNGRQDTDFLRWRWKPDGCQLSRFNPNLFLQIVRGKTMAFIGDSVALNHMESLGCLLSQKDTPVNISTDKSQIWYYPKHNFTLMSVWAVFLVQAEEIIIRHGSPTDNYTLHIDKVSEVWHKELPPVLEYAVVSGGHWFSGRRLYLYEDGILTGCVNCNEPNIPKHDFTYALRMSIRTALKHTERFKGITTVLRTFSPGHFENGEWKTGGYCNRTSPFHELPDATALGESYKWSMKLRNLQLQELERAKRSGVKERRLLALDVTRASMMRPDGHPDTYFGNVWKAGIHDCVHWCLPGPIDGWSDILLGTLLKETPPYTI